MGLLPKLATASFVFVLGASGCSKESAYDVYLQGAMLEGEAEKGPCKLEGGGNTHMPVLSGDQVAECLRLTEKALALYDRAETMGFDDADFKIVHDRARERKSHLESMLAMVRQMEREQMGLKAADEPAAPPAK